MPSARPLAVVTGAGSGIGRAVALELAALGVRVLAVGRRPGPLEETASLAAGIEPLPADVSSEEGRDRIAAAVRACGSWRYLVHAAGVFRLGRLDDLPLDAWRESLGAHVEGPLFLTRALLPTFAPGARILFVDSRSAARPRKGAGAYCVTKAATRMLIHCLGAELEDRDLRVGSALPGSVDTAIVEASIAADPKLFPDALEYRREKASGLLARPAEVGRFLAQLLTGTSDADFSNRDWVFTPEKAR